MYATGCNLARKLRSQNFNEIIGQELTIKILKNSLYKVHYFPVYLFAGQRGCGKTTTARIFSTALNCEQLGTFQKNPKQFIPCLSCISCVSMQAGKHPDFIEVDAASHTGVDNVRQIIESATFLPLMGQKKIYLIDEAHMLSKAAFNALLKILEEPPPSALFILATTMPLKIIDTVRSRCFQLFFKPIKKETLFAYLKKVCKEEKIICDVAALSLIIDQAEGCVRDALNLLEQVRFLGKNVTKEIILETLGYLDDKQLVVMLTAVLRKQPQQLFHVLKMVQQGFYSTEFIWNRLIELLRSLLWVKYGVKQADVCDDLRLLAEKSTLQELHHVLEVLYNYEHLFKKTTAQHTLLETVLLQLCQQTRKKNGGNNGSASLAPKKIAKNQDDELQETEEGDSDYDQENNEEEENRNDDVEQWMIFIRDIEKLDNALILSIFKQGNLLNFEKDNSCLTVAFNKKLLFFRDWLEETRSLWLSSLQKVFSKKVTLKLVFTGSKKNANKISKNYDVRASVNNITKDSIKTTFVRNINEQSIDISDKEKWKKSNLILHYFPSIVTEIRR